jgi:tetratricopeptide (TPR) repeat protein
MKYPQTIAVLLLAVSLSASARAADDAERRQAQLDARIAELIEQLGSTEFPVREKATRELIQIGLPAFDALHLAQNHKDLEIGLRARYLVGSAQVAWTKDDDPPEVKSILKGYGQESEDERRTRIQRLSLLENRLGWTALCRLARYERDERLSKQAALAIITQEELPEAKQVAEVAKSLQTGAGESRRQASQWLRAYARWLSEPETIVSEWNRLVNDEFELINEKERTNPEVVIALGRWHAQTLNRLGHAAETKAMVKRLASVVDRADRSPASLIDHVAWLGHSEMWKFVVDSYQQNSARFDESETLLYHLAEAQRKLGDAADADKTAARARDFKTTSAEHIQAARELTRRGLFDWAEAEFQVVLLSEDIVTPANVEARRLLAEMLHDQEKDLAAGNALEAISDSLEKLDVDQFGKKQPNPMRQMLEGIGYDPGGMMSRMNYFYALSHLQKGEKDKAVARLKQGIAKDPEDADVLIALYRLPDQTAEQKVETRQLIRQAAESFRESITTSSRNLAQIQAQLQGAQIPNLEAYKRQVAMAHNQFAWLVANTEGDYEAAVASSHESLKLRPGEAAYLDTLGSCYYATGDLPNAIKYQAEAVRKDPHSGQMQRMLAKFKREAEQKK